MTAAPKRRWFFAAFALLAALLVAAAVIRLTDTRPGSATDLDVAVGAEPSPEREVALTNGAVEVRGYVVNSDGGSAADLDGRLGELLDMIGHPRSIVSEVDDGNVASQRVGDFVPLVDRDPDLADFVGSDDAFVIADGLRDRLFLQLGCDGAEPPDGIVRPTKMAVAAAIASVPSETARGYLRDAVVAMDAADEACNDDVSTWIDETRAALTHLQKFESALGSTPTSAFAIEASDGDAVDLTQLSADIAVILDRTYAGLTGRNPVQASNVWYSSGHLAHVRGIRRLMAEKQPLDGLIVGDSTAALGVNAHALTRAVDNRFANVAINGARLNVQIDTTNQLLDLTRATAGDEQGSVDTIVWFIQTISFIRLCPTSDLGIGQILASQDAAFASVEWLQPFQPMDRVFGFDASAPRYKGTQLDDDTYRQFNTWDYGMKDPITTFAPDLEQNQIDVWSSVLVAEDICRSELQRVEDTIAQWEREGIDVVVLVPPISEDMAGISPNGWAIHEQVVDELQDVVDATGADLADASRAVDENLFRDLLHIVEAGKPAILDVLTPVVAEVVDGPSA